MLSLIKVFKIVLVFLIISLISLIFLFAILSLALLFCKIPPSLFSKLILACSSIAIFTSSFFVLQLTENYRIFLGLVCGFVFATIVIVSTLLSTRNFLNLNFFIKTGSIVFASLFGAALTKFLK